MQRQPSNEPHRNEPVLEHLIVQRDEQRPDVLSLREVFVEPLVQRLQDRLADVRVWLC